MASPISVLLTTTVLAPVNKNRVSITFQNNGANPVYILKVPPYTQTVPTPSITNYEYILYPPGTDENTITLNTIDGFVAVSVVAPSNVGVLELVKDC